MSLHFFIPLLKSMELLVISLLKSLQNPLHTCLINDHVKKVAYKLIQTIYYKLKVTYGLSCRILLFKY
jgi:hypothetical protein